MGEGGEDVVREVVLDLGDLPEPVVGDGDLRPGQVQEVEVVSEESADRDRSLKLFKYGQARIPHF
ncbi:hypothetical protein ACFCYM_21945 [Streptomyces sp. NPDC056254]|uniref:hypothetical protein n=1 Tax=Streptomyces sp. NPDC056254 TaxID=3345763 RepID=UPI0035DFE4E1